VFPLIVISSTVTASKACAGNLQTNSKDNRTNRINGFMN
jgi:hypothetical protein